MAKQEAKDKIKILKGLLNGTVDFGTIRPPQHYVVIRQFDESGESTGYLIEDIQLSPDEFDKWYKTLKESDGIIVLPEQKEFKRPTIEPATIAEPAVTDIEEKIEDEFKVSSEPIPPTKERVMVTLAQHRALNQRLSKLFK